jgi:hypothetical protein
VAQEVGERHLLLRGELVVGQLPGGQAVVDVLVERELALLHLAQRDHRRHGLTDRPGLKERLGGGRLLRLDILEAVGARPLDLKVFEDGDADGGHLVVAHPLLD